MKDKFRKIAAAALAACLLSSAPVLPGICPDIACAKADTAQGGIIELLDTMQLLAGIDLNGNLATIQLLLDNAMGQSDPSQAYYPMLQAIKDMLNAGNADAASLGALLEAAKAVASVQAQTPAATEAPAMAATEAPAAETTQAPAVELTAEPTEQAPPALPEEEYEKLPDRQIALPPYMPAGYETVAVSQSVAMDIPADWGNNASERAVTSYSPVNKSGAISPGAGTLTTTLLPRDQDSDEAVFDTYESNLSNTSVNTDVVSVRARITGQPARRIRYNMNIGANKFNCEVVCFNYEDKLYTVGLVQGQKSKYDYFSVYDYVVESLKTGDIASLLPKEPQQTPEPALPALPTAEIMPTPDVLPTAQILPQTASGSFEPGEDLAAFTYMINGRKYSFPTGVSSLDPSAMPLDVNAEIASDFASRDDLGNTQYYHLEDALHREMIGVTNMSDRTAFVRDGVVTALLDTQGGDLQLSLPGGICVGASESTIWKGFYEFGITPLDGNSRYRGNEIMYGASITERGDGSHGYVIIRNDAPYYSALSIICKNGKITEIKFECLGGSQASVVFA